MFSDEIIKVLDDLCRRFGIVVDWTSENVMPYLEIIADKIVRWELAQAIIGIVIALIWFGVAVGFVYLAKFCWKKYKEKGCLSAWDMGGTFSYVGTVLCAFIGLYSLFGNIENIVECVIFPEKVVFDFISYYIGTMN